jgi:putative oxidoreductase
MAWLARFAQPIYAVLRIVAGFLFFCHGGQKVLGLFGGHGAPPNGMILASGWIELVAGILIAIGLFTSIAAFISSGEMAVAYFMVHASQGTFPIENHGELAVVYCFLFLYIAAAGSGPWSVDAMIRNRR